MKNAFLILILLFVPAVFLLAQLPANTGSLKSLQESFIVINELMASNLTTQADNYGEFDDWIELYNNTDIDFNLSGYYLSDNPANLDKWEMPEGTILPAMGYLIFWADEDSAQGANHCNFKLSGAGELLMLLDSQLLLVDSVNFGPQLTDMGYARVPNGYGNFVIQLPTYNANNGNLSTSEEPVIFPVKVFPNPVVDFLQIEIPDNMGIILVEIYDCKGSLVYRSEKNGTMRIHTSSWTPGLYTLKAGSGHQKIIIE